MEGFERLSKEIEDWGAPRRVLLAGQVVWSPETYTKLLSTLRESRPDVVHVHNTFPLDLSEDAAKKKLFTNLVFTFLSDRGQMVDIFRQ